MVCWVSQHQKLECMNTFCIIMNHCAIYTRTIRIMCLHMRALMYLNLTCRLNHRKTSKFVIFDRCFVFLWYVPVRLSSRRELPENEIKLITFNSLFVTAVIIFELFNMKRAFLSAGWDLKMNKMRWKVKLRNLRFFEALKSWEGFSKQHIIN
jgi:hypothetical protein